MRVIGSGVDDNDVLFDFELKDTGPIAINDPSREIILETQDSTCRVQIHATYDEWKRTFVWCSADPENLHSLLTPTKVAQVQRDRLMEILTEVYKRGMAGGICDLVPFANRILDKTLTAA